MNRVSVRFDLNISMFHKTNSNVLRLKKFNGSQQGNMFGAHRIFLKNVITSTQYFSNCFKKRPKKGDYQETFFFIGDGQI